MTKLGETLNISWNIERFYFQSSFEVDYKAVILSRLKLQEHSLLPGWQWATLVVGFQKKIVGSLISPAPANTENTR